MPRKLRARLRPRYILLCLLLGLLVLAGVAVSQAAKLDEIKVQQEQLTARQEALLLEEQRLQHMLDYAQTDAYKEQYARETFGYLGPNDYKFYTEE